LRERIIALENEVTDSRSVVLALLGTIAAQVKDDECVKACRELVGNLQARWGWTEENAVLDTAVQTYFCGFCSKPIKVKADPEAPPLKIELHTTEEDGSIHMRLDCYACSTCLKALKEHES
jgi:hypothetical protein